MVMMKRLRAWATALVAMLLIAAPLLAMQPPRPPDEFVPIEQLPPSEQLPSAPLLVGAYAFVWLAVMFYLWTIWRRLAKVENDLQALAQKTRSSAR